MQPMNTKVRGGRKERNRVNFYKKTILDNENVPIARLCIGFKLFEIILGAVPEIRLSCFFIIFCFVISQKKFLLNITEAIKVSLNPRNPH